jgi:CRP/FNR family transcriptional regulator/CRP/FNR family cyclic AMP-dependent transcriptional regulator
MELVGRMMDGSFFGGAGPQPSSSGSGIDDDDRVERLEQVPLFQTCSRRQLKAIARISETFDVPTGTVLTRTGESGEEFFLIVDGAVRVEVSARRQIHLGAGEYFGEMSLLDGEPRSATAVAETSVRLLVIRRRHFQKLLEDTPGIGRSLLITLCRRVRDAERALAQPGPAQAREMP